MLLQGEKIMRYASFFGIVCLLFLANTAAFAQAKPFNRYEIEILSNPTVGKKDTRQVNSVIIFEAEKVVVKSRRNAEVFKEINYSDIKSAEHSFSKRPWLSQTAVSLAATLLSGLPFYLGNNEKHWLTIVSDKDFFVLKLENDNFRQIKAEFSIKNVEVEDIKDGETGTKKSKKTAGGEKKKDSNE